MCFHSAPQLPKLASANIGGVWGDLAALDVAYSLIMFYRFPFTRVLPTIRAPPPPQHPTQLRHSADRRRPLCLPRLEPTFIVIVPLGRRAQGVGPVAYYISWPLGCDKKVLSTPSAMPRCCWLLLLAVSVTFTSKNYPDISQCSKHSFVAGMVQWCDQGSLRCQFVSIAGSEFCWTWTREWLLWQGPEAIVRVNYRPILSSERVPSIKNSAIVRQKRKIWSWAPDSSPTPRQTGWLTVGRKLNFNFSSLQSRYSHTS
jgi:hypothetical protein